MFAGEVVEQKLGLPSANPQALWAIIQVKGLNQNAMALIMAPPLILHHGDD